MKAWGKATAAAAGRARPAVKLEPVQVWSGKPMVVKLKDWASFCAVNHLRVVRSRIAGDEGGVLKVEVEVEDEAKVKAEGEG